MAELLMRTFRFQVKLRQSPQEVAGEAPVGVTDVAGDSRSGAALGNGAFQEVSGLETTMDVGEYLEGGRNDGIIRRAGRARYQPIVLKRGIFYSTGSGGGPAQANKELWTWIQGVFAGLRPIKRYDGMIEVFGAKEEVVATWVFDRGLPARIKGPELNGKTGDIAIEELHIAHEGLRLV